MTGISTFESERLENHRALEAHREELRIAYPHQYIAIAQGRQVAAASTFATAVGEVNKLHPLPEHCLVWHPGQGLPIDVVNRKYLDSPVPLASSRESCEGLSAPGNLDQFERERAILAEAYASHKDQWRREYAGQFIGLAFGRVVAAGTDYEQVAAKMEALQPAPAFCAIFPAGEEPLFDVIEAPYKEFV